MPNLLPPLPPYCRKEWHHHFVVVVVVVVWLACRPAGEISEANTNCCLCADFVVLLIFPSPRRGQLFAEPLPVQSPSLYSSNKSRGPRSFLYSKSLAGINVYRDGGPIDAECPPYERAMRAGVVSRLALVPSFFFAIRPYGALVASGGCGPRRDAFDCVATLFEAGQAIPISAPCSVPS